MLERLHRSRFRALLLLVVGAFVVFTATRLVLATMLVVTDGARPAATVLHALGAGLLPDALAALAIGSPLLLRLLLSRDRRWTATPRTTGLSLWLAVMAAWLAFVALAEVLFFDEFTGRFNFVAVDYLIYPTEVGTNLRESYPLPAILAAIAALGVLAWFGARRALRPVAATPVPPRQRLAIAGGYAAACAATFALWSPTWNVVADDRAVNEVAANGWISFTQALAGQDAPYEGLYATRPEPQVEARLRTLLASEHAAPFVGDGIRRRIAPSAPPRRLNVVLVLEESLGASFVGTLHPEGERLTPHLDSLAAEGLLFTHAYSTGNRTIRALEATTSGLPPLPGVSIVRRDASEGLYTLPALLAERGYRTEFIYGGRALFDNMGHYMRANGMQRVTEQADYPPGLFTTAWGVPDEAIFDMTLRRLDALHASGAPFFAQVLTVSNHKPYTYPTGRIPYDPAARRRDHAVRYADWALGRFMREARTHAWFDSTLFVLMGDHGARVYGASEIPLASYEVPIVLYGPKLVPPGTRVPALVSSLDLPPTILGLLRQPYESRFLGRDVLAPGAGPGRALATHNSEVALMVPAPDGGLRVAVLGLRGATRVYRWDAAAARLVEVPAPDAADRALVEDAIAFYTGADRLYRSGGYRLAAPPARTATRQAGARGGVSGRPSGSASVSARSACSRSRAACG